MDSLSETVDYVKYIYNKYIEGHKLITSKDNTDIDNSAFTVSGSYIYVDNIKINIEELTHITVSSCINAHLIFEIETKKYLIVDIGHDERDLVCNLIRFRKIEELLEEPTL